MNNCKFQLKLFSGLLFISQMVFGSVSLDRNDFAYGMNLSLEAHQLYEVVLDDSIYAHFYHDDLRDLRVFDEQGVILPLNIMAGVGSEQKQTQYSISTEPLVFFPVGDNFLQPMQDLNVHVQRNASGTIVNINSASVADVQQQNIYYIVDLGERINPDMQALEIIWDGAQAPKNTVTVHTSHDLTHWQPAGQGAVFQLRHNQQSLLHNLVAVNAPKRYLKISLDQSALQGLNAINKKTVGVDKELKTARASLLRQSAMQYFYRIPGCYPVQSLHVYPQQKDAIYSIRLFGGEDAGIQNQLQYQGNIYQLGMGNETYSTESITQIGQKNNLWRIDVIESNQNNISAPVFEFAYYPHRIRFLSNQAGQYTIAFGSAAVNHFGPVIPQSVNQNDSHIKKLDLPMAYTLSGDKKLVPLPPANKPTKMILWTVLVLVLLLMGFMVMRLLRHMRDSK